MGERLNSRDGFDVAAEFKVPKLRWISGGLTHYKWDGEFGDADDKGVPVSRGFWLFGADGGRGFLGRVVV